MGRKGEKFPKHAEKTRHIMELEGIHVSATVYFTAKLFSINSFCLAFLIFDN